MPSDNDHAVANGAKVSIRERDEAFRRLVSESGNAFHCQVATYFRERSWEVLISPYYVDNATGRAREIDLLCERLWEFRDPHNPNVSRLLRVQLLVECKYIPETTATVFWFDKSDDGGKRSQLVQASIPQFKTHSLLVQHHYYARRDSGVAKLFASDSKRGEEKEPIYVALTQCLGALIQLGAFTLMTNHKASEVDATLTCRYPVVVCSSFDRFRRTNVQGADPAPVTDNFLLEVNYAFTNSANRPVQRFALIDMVSWQLIDRFLAELEKEVDAVRLVFGY
jgi:hypothetical protein